MSEQGSSDPSEIGGKTEVEWAWEFHRNCDQLLHQRLAAFTAAQAMTLAAFMVLTVARFQPQFPQNRILYVELARFTIDVFGLLLSMFTWLVTAPMLTRLVYLDNFLKDKIPKYKEYHEDALEDFQVPGWKQIDRILARIAPLLRWMGVTQLEREQRRFYRNVIPIFLPICEIALWSILFILLIMGNLTTLMGFWGVPFILLMLVIIVIWIGIPA